MKLTNVAALTDGGVVRYGPRQPYRVHRAYEEKRGRGGNFMHKLTARIAGELEGLRSGAVLET